MDSVALDYLLVSFSSVNPEQSSAAMKFLFDHQRDSLTGTSMSCVFGLSYIRKSHDSLANSEVEGWKKQKKK